LWSALSRTIASDDMVFPLVMVTARLPFRDALPSAQRLNAAILGGYDDFK